MVSPTWLIAQIIPPALVTYFARTLYICSTEIGLSYLTGRGFPVLGPLYALFTLVSIPTVSFLFLRLYFLPSDQSVPPEQPLESLRSKQVVFECLSPDEAKAVRRANNENTEGLEDDPLFDRCWKGKCRGRWKPARARHCSECDTCRGGFDHHCGFFANCLTAPYIPTFMCLLTLTPIFILVLVSPLVLPMNKRALEAFWLSRSDETIKQWWYDWPLSWVVAGGPVGRFVGGIILGWKELDRRDGGESLRVGNGILVAVGMVLALMCGGLGFATARLVRAGHLTVDRERARSLARARHAVTTLRKANRPVPEESLRAMERWKDRHYFWVPDADHAKGGRIVEYQGTVNPYDRGVEGNWEFVMGKGWRWLLPWVALNQGVSREDIFNWPVAPGVEAALRRTDL